MLFRVILFTLFYVSIISCSQSDKAAEDVSIGEVL